MTLRAITFDFWSTLVDGNITPERTAQRLARLHRAIAGAGHTFTPEDLRRAFERALDRITESARESYEDVGPPGRWAVLARELGIADGLIPYEVVVHARGRRSGPDRGRLRSPRLARFRRSGGHQILLSAGAGRRHKLAKATGRCPYHCVK